MSEVKSTPELKFEQIVIKHLTQIGGVKQWDYKPEIKTTEQLWNNFKRILEQNNQARIDESLSTTEFNQVKAIISRIQSPYKAGQFLYGVNGVSEIEIDLDNGKHVFLTVFDQAQVGGGDTVYQVVNQIERPKIVDGKKDRRFDVTLLINGLPIIQIELKNELHHASESLNQMEQYIAEKQYSDIFSTLQILIAMTPYDIKYMANTPLKSFNRAFAFNWQNEDDALPVRRWKDFSNQVLSIPMAHDLATRYMILDGTKNKENIKVMRPYQVYATRRVLDKVRKYDFKSEDGKLGYVWHTTGSGKTITSFKTAWLASRLPNVDKVVFLVDRIALTNQTTNAYRAYDPIASFEGKTGVVSDTANISDLHRKLTKRSDENIIVTSIQKMSRYVSRESFKPLKQNILFIVDEAHRSTSETVKLKQEVEQIPMLKKIRDAIPDSAWVGYTGTPKFPETKVVFGDVLHTYTIKEAIADRNVLGFNVEFKNTIQVSDTASAEEIDDATRASVYDHSDEHAQLVVEDIFKNWNQRSNNRRYNALFTVHVGGGKASTPRAMEYFDKFIQENQNRPEQERLKVAVSFSDDTSNGANQLKTNENLLRAIQHYNQMFFGKTNGPFDMKTVKAYTEDIVSRLNKTADDGQFLDLVIVIDQLLTGFDSPELNTLYVDRTLKGGNLIQAYSRTNRIHDMVEKPSGNIVNYRWPVQNEYEMNKSFAIYSNRASADKKESTEDLKTSNENAGIISKPFGKVQAELKEVIDQLSNLTDGFVKVPDSEKDQENTFDFLRQYSRLLAQLKQYTVDDQGNPISAYTDPDEFYERIGITGEDEIMLTTVIANDLKERRAVKENIDISQVDLEMVHIHDVKIDYDYLIELIAKMADAIHESRESEARETREDIHREIAKSENDHEKLKMSAFVEGIYSGEILIGYPAPVGVEEMNQLMEEAYTKGNIQILRDFIQHWGLDNAIKPNQLEDLIKKHEFQQEDLDRQNELADIMNEAKTDYKRIAAEAVAKLSWVKYRIELRKAVYEMADNMRKGE